MTGISAPVVEIDGCRTVSKLFWQRVNSCSDKVALREKDFGIWNEYTWGDFGDKARLVGLGLKALGLQRGDICSIASEINKEWLFADLGIIGAGGVCNGVYPTDAAEQVEYLVNDSGTRFYFVEDEEQLDKILAVRERTPSLSKIIIFDMEGLRTFEDEQCLSFAELLNLGKALAESSPKLWEADLTAADPEDLMILTYTSGTTGPPKGAM
ncbi:MAG: long-chain acyl-CoA synthetase, partial [Halieaceae bacterium]